MFFSLLGHILYTELVYFHITHKKRRKEGMSLWRHWKHVVPSDCNCGKVISPFLPMTYSYKFCGLSVILWSLGKPLYQKLSWFVHPCVGSRAGIKTFLFFKESFKKQFLCQNARTVPFFVPFPIAGTVTFPFLFQFLYTHTPDANPVSQLSTINQSLYILGLILHYFTAVLNYLILFYYNIT